VGVYEPPPYKLPSLITGVGVGVGRVEELPDAELEGSMDAATMETPLTIWAEAALMIESPKIIDFMIKRK